MKSPYDMTLTEVADAVGRYAQLREDLARLARHMGLPAETPPFILMCQLTDCVSLISAIAPDRLASYAANAEAIVKMLERNK